MAYKKKKSGKRKKLGNCVLRTKIIENEIINAYLSFTPWLLPYLTWLLLPVFCFLLLSLFPQRFSPLSVCSALLTSGINIRNSQAYHKKLIKRGTQNDKYIFCAFWHLFLLNAAKCICKHLDRSLVYLRPRNVIFGPDFVEAFIFPPMGTEKHIERVFLRIYFYECYWQAAYEDLL